MNQKKLLIVALVTLAAVFIGALIWQNLSGQSKNQITSYEECAAAGYPILDSYPEQCRVPNRKTYTRNINSETSITVRGTTVCLPHKNMDGPHTLECAMGIKGDNNKYYGMRSDPYDAALSEVNRKIEVRGTLKDSPDSSYDIESTITVNSYTFLDTK